ncbi:hypothetical protein PR048_005917 [Dryococelus australis]|uniref:Uncharacterized protein n=1 Tax=Dryococelus australis TaxID=614101 RepID=A0ABQ9I9L6_9NEOP|nr:hypothetical protein PR048_005917 [Dryococelus australis]
MNRQLCVDNVEVSRLTIYVLYIFRLLGQAAVRPVWNNWCWSACVLPSSIIHRLFRPTALYTIFVGIAIYRLSRKPCSRAAVLGAGFVSPGAPETARRFVLDRCRDSTLFTCLRCKEYSPPTWEPGPIPGYVAPRFSRVDIVSDHAAGRRDLLGKLSFIPLLHSFSLLTLLHTYWNRDIWASLKIEVLSTDVCVL